MIWRELLKQSKDVPDRERLLSGIMKWSFGESALHLDDEADPEKEKVFLQGIFRLRKREPLQYILGEAPFFGRMFYVDERVLIPRFDTEILVEEALQEIGRLREQGMERPEVLDLCTGSGCIALTLKAEQPAIQITASDLMSGALEVASRNSMKLFGNEDQARFLKSDLFSEINDEYDLVVTNPPYIKTADIEKLDPEVRDHEPRGALDGGEDGLDLIRKIAKDAKRHLRPNAMILVEIGDEEGEEAVRIFEKEGYQDLGIRKDLAGRDRVVFARKGKHE